MVSTVGGVGDTHMSFRDHVLYYTIQKKKPMIVTKYEYNLTLKDLHVVKRNGSASGASKDMQVGE